MCFGIGPGQTHVQKTMVQRPLLVLSYVRDTCYALLLYVTLYLLTKYVHFEPIFNWENPWNSFFANYFKNVFLWHVSFSACAYAIVSLCLDI